jgi:hypothetical protein
LEMKIKPLWCHQGLNIQGISIQFPGPWQTSSPSFPHQRLTSKKSYFKWAPPCGLPEMPFYQLSSRCQCWVSNPSIALCSQHPAKLCPDALMAPPCHFCVLFVDLLPASFPPASLSLPIQNAPPSNLSAPSSHYLLTNDNRPFLGTSLIRGHSPAPSPSDLSRTALGGSLGRTGLVHPFCR